MSHTLMAVLGSVLVDGRFRKGLLEQSERVAWLKQHGFFLSRGEFEVFQNMMKSFECGKLDDVCLKIAAECPNWPCSYFSAE